MIDEAIRQKAALGARFKEVLPAINEGLDAIEAEYAAALLDCFNRDERDNLWLAVRIVRKLKDHFGAIVSDGTVASHQLTEIKRLK